MNDTVLVSNQSVQDQRANAVKTELESLVSKTEDATFDLADLLWEARTNSYHQAFGFARFSDWVELTPSFDMSARQASYLVNIADKALRLEVDRATMKRIKITKLKEIFSLDPDIHHDEMLSLIDEAEAMSLEEVKSRVRALKSQAGEETMLFMTIKFPASAKEVIDIAFEKYRRLIGTLQDKYGEQVDPPNGTVLERMCADIAAGPDEDEFNYDNVEPSDGYDHLVDMHEELVSA